MNDIFLKNFILWTQFVESCWNDYKNYWIDKLNKKPKSDFDLYKWQQEVNDMFGAKWFHNDATINYPHLKLEF